MCLTDASSVYKVVNILHKHITMKLAHKSVLRNAAFRCYSDGPTKFGSCSSNFCSMWRCTVFPTNPGHSSWSAANDYNLKYHMTDSIEPKLDMQLTTLIKPSYHQANVNFHPPRFSLIRHQLGNLCTILFFDFLR